MKPVLISTLEELKYNLETIESYLDEVSSEASLVYDAIKNYRGNASNLTDAKSFWISVLPSLKIIMSRIGEDDPFMKSISTAVCQCILNTLIAVVNDQQSKFVDFETFKALHMTPSRRTYSDYSVLYEYAEEMTLRNKWEKECNSKSNLLRELLRDCKWFIGELNYLPLDEPFASDRYIPNRDLLLELCERSGLIPYDQVELYKRKSKVPLMYKDESSFARFFRKRNENFKRFCAMPLEYLTGRRQIIASFIKKNLVPGFVKNYSFVDVGLDGPSGIIGNIVFAVIVWPILQVLFLIIGVVFIYIGILFAAIAYLLISIPILTLWLIRKVRVMIKHDRYCYK